MIKLSIPVLFPDQRFIESRLPRIRIEMKDGNPCHSVPVRTPCASPKSKSVHVKNSGFDGRRPQPHFFCSYFSRSRFFFPFPLFFKKKNENLFMGESEKRKSLSEFLSFKNSSSDFISLTQFFWLPWMCDWRNLSRKTANLVSQNTDSSDSCQVTPFTFLGLNIKKKLEVWLEEILRAYSLGFT